MEPEEENLRVFSFAELNKATKKFTQYMVINGDPRGFSRTFYKGYINETTFSPSRTETGIAVSVMECHQADSQALEEWKVTKNLSIPRQLFIISFLARRSYKWLHKKKKKKKKQDLTVND